MPKFLYRYFLWQLAEPYMEGADSTIRECVDWYIRNHARLEDTQSSIHVVPFLRFMRQTGSIPGDILELGSYKCGTTILLSHYLDMLGSDKKIYACDTFSGFPYEDRFNDKSVKLKIRCNDTSLGYVTDKIASFQAAHNIRLVAGSFEDTLYQRLAEKRFSFVLVDCDLYDATKFSLPFAYDRMERDAVCAFDEYRIHGITIPRWGETRAADEFAAQNHISILLEPMAHFVKDS